MGHQEQFRRAALALDVPEDEVSRFIGHLRWAIRLDGLADPDGIPVGRFGGPPRLPVGTSWPDNGQGDLPFVFSVDCAALPRVDGFDLPRDGSLLFFLDHQYDHEECHAEHRGYARVMHIPAGVETAVAEPPHPELVADEQYDVDAAVVAWLPDCLDMDEREMLPFHEQLARELRSSMPHLDELEALADELWPSSDGLSSGFLGGYPDDELLETLAEQILREREKTEGTTIPQEEWFDRMADEQRQLMNEWMSLASFLPFAEFYYGRMSIHRDDLAAGRLDRMLSMTHFTE
ncbi:DUF1963 domain-containing protein [Promicromonospora aerolata]|uniref:DUF1963 domain-containing protein n=1 Tax=Promicromonospora aerolata TaxID=195749 RepID=A0ABW4V7M8_9MICO